MKNPTIKRINKGYKPLFLDGWEIEDILIYRDGKIIFGKQYFGGWLKHHTDNKRTNVVQIFLEDVKISKKIDLTRKYNFAVKNKEESTWNNKQTMTLYIHESNASVRQLTSEIVKAENEGVRVIDFVEINICCHLENGNVAYNIIEKRDLVLREDSFPEDVKEMQKRLKNIFVNIDLYNIQKLMEEDLLTI